LQIMQQGGSLWSWVYSVRPKKDRAGSGSGGSRGERRVGMGGVEEVGVHIQHGPPQGIREEERG
jgi:hypothetical protein